MGQKAFPRLPSEEWLPSLEFSETGDNLLIRAELPDMDAKDVEVTLSGNMLTIKGEKKKEEEEKGESYYSSERYYGACERALRLPVEVQTDKAEATFDIMTMLQDQTEGVVNSFLDQASWVPEEGKKLINEWVKAYKSGCSGYKDMVDQCFNTMQGGFGASKKTKS